MAEYKMVRLGDYITEYSVKNKSNEDIPVYSVTNTQGFCTEYFSKDVSSKDKSNYKIVPRGCFAYNPSRINVGSVDWQRYEDRVIVSPLYNVFKVSPELENQYLYYFLKSDIGHTLITSKAEGSVRDNLKITMLAEFSIPLPPLETQKLIAAQLDKCTALIAKHKQMLEKYDTLIKSRFIEMFGDPVLNPMNWPVMKLKSLTSKIGSGATPKGGRESYISEGIALVRSMNVYNGGFEYDGLAHITEEQAKELNNVTLMENDILINITGASVARCCVLPSDVLPARVNQHVSILRTKEEINPIYLSNLLISDSEQRVLLEIGGAGGATREAITKTELEELKILVPPLTLQNNFAAFVQQIDKSKFEIANSLKRLYNKGMLS